MSASERELQVEVKLDLHKAASAGDFDSVTRLLDGGENVNLINSQKCTPLHLASKGSSADHHEVVKLLLKHGAEVDAADNTGSRPLHKASRANNYTTIKLLLDHGADVNKANFTGVTPLFEACMVGCKDIVKLLLDRCANVTLNDNKGQTPLHMASAYGHIDAIKLLLEYGANVNSRSTECCTPLHLACYQLRERLEVLDVLIDGGADVNATCRNGCTALHLSVDIYYARGHRFYRKLLQKGAAIDIRNWDNETPYDLCSLDMDEEENEGGIKAEMIEHIIMLKSAGLFVDIDIKAELDFFEKTQLECFLELETINSIKINEDFSLSVVFLNCKNPWYLKNQSLFQGLEEILHSPDLKERLPIYTHLLKNTFEKTKKCYMLLDKAFNTLLSENRREWCRQLPYLVKIEVLNYLTNDDLLNLITSEDEY